MQDARLEAMRLGNPAARALPLLECIARRRSARIGIADTEAADTEPVDTRRALGIQVHCS